MTVSLILHPKTPVHLPVGSSDLCKYLLGCSWEALLAADVAGLDPPARLRMQRRS